ncbi:bifunctional DNA primase/polymerase [Mycobacteroides abscessus subsp. abscessus]|uniref:bifunctional DNA primase/polymerase n=1 Tax=Mycobacteroides abscessus TaxID=36809 RepID=UPI0039F00AA1
MSNERYEMQSNNRTADLTALLSQAPTDATDHEAVGKFVRRLAEAGCSVLFIHPGSKLPADMRSPQRRRADDKAAQDAARDAGRRDWARVQSPAGLALATTDVDTLDGYLARYVKVFTSRYPDGVPVNLAVEVGGSGLVVIDCDTAAQMRRWYEVAGIDLGAPDSGAAPTVRSPGQRDPLTGEWAHSDGGHFWFAVPEGVTLPTGPASLGAMTFGDSERGDDGFAVLWDRRYVLIPPSVRAEGAYAVDSGRVYGLPDWLAEAITQAGEARAERAARSRTRVHGGGAVTRWGAETAWDEILAPTAWLPTGKTDSCGCETWTAPGVHASPKSATAHEPGCTFTDSPDPHLQVWTDHDAEPFEHWRNGGEASFPVSRLQAVAAIHYDNNLGAAMTDLSDTYDDLAVDLPADFGREARADDGDDARPPQLAEEFWSAHPRLAHIRQFAHYGVNSADAVLGAALVRLSAHLDPCVRIVTGVKRPLPLNTFVGIVGSAGTGKSSAYHASADLLDFEFGDPMAGDLIAPADQCPPELPVGSGPGVAEAFMGLVVPDPLNPKIKVRTQVRHKVLLHSDEGAGLVSGIIDAKRGQDIGPTLRAAWTGAVLGQANASAERTREVRDYSLGLCVGFQLEALAALSTPEQLEYGTPQRFVYVAATDPTIPDDAPDNPGPLTVPLPHGPLHYDAELRARARREALARARGEDDTTGDDLMQAHRPALAARCAALLVILCDPGRTEIHADDVALAEMLLDTSARLHETAMEWRREREAAERERQLQGRIREQVATAVALDGRADDLKRLSDRIVRYVDDAAGGAVEWTGRKGVRKNKFDNADRPMADAALERLCAEDGPLVRDGDTVRRRS